MHYRGFERLIKKMDEIAPELGEEVVMQIGNTNYTPINTKTVRFLDNNNMNEYYNSASLIISHGGAGTIIEVLAAQKPMIIVPRLKRYGEVIDDQQDELARALSDDGLAKVVYNAEDLASAINSVRDHNFVGHNSQKNLIRFLKKTLNEGES